MRLITLLLLPLLAISAAPSQKAVSGPNQGMIAYCSGSGCSLWGTPILDLSNAGNWTYTTRIRFDAAVGDGTHDMFSQETLVGGAITCPGIFVRAKKTGASFPVVIHVGIAGGLGSNIVVTGSTNLAPATWYSIVLTHDSSHNWNLYVNGALDGSANSSQTIGTGCNVFIATISGATDCGGSETGCWINDVAMIPGILSTGDILAFASGTRPNLLSIRPSAWWPMDGGQPKGCSGPLGGGSPDIDESGNGHTLKLGNDPAPDYCGTGVRTNATVMPATGEATH